MRSVMLRALTFSQLSVANSWLGVLTELHMQCSLHLSGALSPLPREQLIKQKKVSDTFGI